MTTELARIEQELLPSKAEASEILSLIRQFEIRDQADLDYVAEVTREVTTRHHVIENKRTAITKPMLEAKRQVDALFMPVLRTLENIQAALRLKLRDYNTRQEEARIAAMRASAETFQAGGVPAEIIPEPAQAKGVTMALVWDYEVTDPDAVPRAFCSPDDGKIAAAIPKDGEPAPIPGVRFFRDSKVTVRKK